MSKRQSFVVAPGDNVNLAIQNAASQALSLGVPITLIVTPGTYTDTTLNLQANVNLSCAGGGDAQTGGAQFNNVTSLTFPSTGTSLITIQNIYINVSLSNSNTINIASGATYIFIYLIHI